MLTHATVAMATGNDIWMIESEEADTLAKALGKVSSHYELPGVSKAAKDWIGLIMVAGTIYGKRFMAQAAKNALAPKPASQPRQAPQAEAPRQTFTQPEFNPNVRRPDQSARPGGNPESINLNRPGLPNVTLDLKKAN